MLTPPRLRFAANDVARGGRLLSHLSVEVGHVDGGRLTASNDQLHRHFQQVAPWVDAARKVVEANLAGRVARVSTCFLVDDYFAEVGSPDSVIPDLVKAAGKCGLEIDYVARESACAETGGIPLAHLVERRVTDAPPASGKKATTDTGRLIDVQHEVTLNVALFEQQGGKRTWSCAMLAAVWQLLRLGLLPEAEKLVDSPHLWDDTLPATWEEFPAVLALSPDAAPFAAYRTLSILPARFLPTEHAVRALLNRVAKSLRLNEEVVQAARAEGFRLPDLPLRRIEYVFLG